MDKETRKSLESEFEKILENATKFVKGRHDHIERLAKERLDLQAKVRRLEEKVTMLEARKNELEKMFKMVDKMQADYAKLKGIGGGQ